MKNIRKFENFFDFSESGDSGYESWNNLDNEVGPIDLDKVCDYASVSTNFPWEKIATYSYLDSFEESEHYNPQEHNTTKKYAHAFTDYLDGISDGSIED